MRGIGLAGKCERHRFGRDVREALVWQGSVRGMGLAGICERNRFDRDV